MYQQKFLSNKYIYTRKLISDLSNLSNLLHQLLAALSRIYLRLL